MRILVANIAAAEEDSESGRFLKTVLASLCRRNMDLFRQKDTELTFRFPSQGMLAEDWADCQYIDHINPESVFPAIVQAEKEGFDAAIVACFGDPMLSELRQTVSIPVVGLAESSFLMATLIGHKFGLVLTSPGRTDELEQRMAEYGLKKLLVGFKFTFESGRELEMASTDALHSIEVFEKAARELIADGAEVILPACGLAPPVLRLAPGAEKEYPNGITDVDGVPVMDLMGNTVKMAEMLVALRGAGSRPTSREGLHTQATAGAPDSPGFWDC